MDSHYYSTRQYTGLPLYINGSMRIYCERIYSSMRKERHTYAAVCGIAVNTYAAVCGSTTNVSAATCTFTKLLCSSMRIYYKCIRSNMHIYKVIMLHYTDLPQMYMQQHADSQSDYAITCGITKDADKRVCQTTRRLKNKLNYYVK